MKTLFILSFLIFLLVINSAFAISCTRNDFIMGAITFSYASDAGKIKILKDSGFNWLRLIFDGNILTSGTYIDHLNLAEQIARNEAGWNYKYDVLLEFDSVFENYSAQQLADFTQNVINNIKNYNIDIYEVGGELDNEGFAGREPKTCKNGNCTGFNPDNISEWDKYWNDTASLIKPTIEKIRSLDPDAKILLHLANSHKFYHINFFISRMISNGVNFDDLGFTVYHTAYGDNTLLNRAIDRAKLYRKNVTISEFGGYPNNDCGDWALPFGWPFKQYDDYTLDNTGQASYIRDELNFLKGKPNVLGVFYVGPLEAVNFFCPEVKSCSINLGNVDGQDGDDYYCWFGSLIEPNGTLKPAMNEVRNFMKVNSLECIGKNSLTYWCDENMKKGCNANCQYSEINCKNSGSNYYCSNGVCTYPRTGGSGCPILKAWDGQEFKEIELLNIHAPKDQDTTYTSSFSMQPKDGKYEIILHEAAYWFWDGSHINSVNLVDSTGRECRLLSAVHSKQGDVLSAISYNDNERVRTYPGEEIKLVYDGCSDSDFKFTIEGYNMKTICSGGACFTLPYILEVAIPTISFIVLAVIEIIVVIAIVRKLHRKQYKRKNIERNLSRKTN